MRCANMRVYNEDGCTRLLLHRNRIAQMDAAGVISISTCGWNTRTTLDRLNGILDRLHIGRAYCRKFELHLNGAPWSGEWTVVYDPAAVAASKAWTAVYAPSAVQAARYAAREVALLELDRQANAFDVKLKALAAEREAAAAVELDRDRDLLRSSACKKCGFIVHALGCSGQTN